VQFVYHQLALIEDAQPRIDRWLDIGAGYGCLLDEVAKHGIKIRAGVEASEHCWARLKNHGHQLYKALSEVEGPIDIISFSHLLEHLGEPHKFLIRVKHMLANRGYVFCEVPNEICLQNAGNDAPHLIFFTTPSLVTVFQKAGFEVVAVRTCGRLGRGLRDGLMSMMRRIGMRVFQHPPEWFDRVAHPHFHYSQKSDASWIRLLARKAFVS
jgi:predicted TPR repeat methyltransferase